MQRLILELNPAVPGFTNTRVLGFVSSIILQYKPQNCVEIGSFMGRSAVAIASSMAMIGAKGKLTCVDLFKEKVDQTFLDYEVVKLAFQHAGTEGYHYQDLKRISNIGDCFDVTFERFNHLKPFVEKITANSCGITFAPGKVFDLSYIDGDHSYAGVSNDFKMILPCIRDGHIAIFDDYSDQFPDVRKFVDELFATPGASKLGFEHPDIAVRLDDVERVRPVWLE